MKRLTIVLSALLMTFGALAQKPSKFTENDIKQFYRTMQGDYDIAINDSTNVTVHFTPIWENEPFRWLYVEALQGKDILLQKVIKIVPKNDKVFKVVIHNLKHPGQFAGKWANRNYFDGFTKSILGGTKKTTFYKTSDFSYQSHWIRLGVLECFPKGDVLHFKFVQADERFYIKRMPANTTRIIGYQGQKQLAD